MVMINDIWKKRNNMIHDKWKWQMIVINDDDKRKHDNDKWYVNIKKLIMVHDNDTYWWYMKNEKI